MLRVFVFYTIMQTYSEKLKSPKWQRKRLEILKRDNFKCVLCGDIETELHINHKKYTKEPWDAPNKDLETLCKHCHEFKHAIDVDILKMKKMIREDIVIFIFNTIDKSNIGRLNLTTKKIVWDVSFEFNCDIVKNLFNMNING